MITRRGLLEGLLGGIVAASLPRACRSAAAAAPVRSLAVGAWGKWKELPGTGLEVHATRAVTVTWTADGTITAPLLLTPPVTGSARGTQHVTSGPGYGLAVRRIGT
jgi:hypothetical protein